MQSYGAHMNRTRLTGLIIASVAALACSGPTTSVDAGSSGSGGAGGAGGSAGGSAGGTGAGPELGGCPLLPANHVFNTRIDSLPVHPSSAAFIATIGATRRVHLDLGTQTNQAAADYYGIPFNLVHGASFAWPRIFFRTSDTSLSWDPTEEADCAVGTAHQLVSPCTATAAPAPVVPIPATPLVEGGIDTDPSHPYGDHHILLLDVDACRLWETYHSYPAAGGAWDVFGVASFDLRSNALRPREWTSADAAGFPILPLLARADEAAAGSVRHALRFTIQSSKIRNAWTWPARHKTNNGTLSMNLPPMGQLFRLKSTYVVPANANAQSRALILALQQYGMYLADGGSDMYLQGNPSAAWASATFSTMQSIAASEFEAVDLSVIEQRAGFNPDSAAVP